MAGKAVYFQTKAQEAARLDLVERSDHISDQCKAFVATLVESMMNGEGSKATRQSFIERLKEKGLAHSAGVIARHLETLKSKGVLQEDGDRFIAGKKCTIFTIQDLHLLAPKNEVSQRAARRTKEHIDRQLNLFDQSGTQLRTEFDQLPITQSIMCIIDAAMRSSKTDTSGSDGAVVSQYRLNKSEVVTIKATTSTEEGSEIAILSDLRVIRALNAMLLDQLKIKLKEAGIKRRSIRSMESALPVAKKMAGELYYVDIDDICRRIGLHPYQANRESVRAIIRRIKDTKFEVDGTQSASFRKRYFPDDSTSVGEYRFITEFYAAKEEHVDPDSQLVTYTEKYYWVKFHEQIVANLLVDWLAFVGHPQLFVDDSGIAQRFANWLKAWIGVSKFSSKSNAEFHYLPSELHQLVLPHVRSDNFHRDFINLMKRQVERGEGVENKGCSQEWRETEGAIVLTWFYGYFITLDFSKDVVLAHCNTRGLRTPRSRKPVPLITITRDTADEFVGDESPYNLILEEERESEALKIEAEQADPEVTTTGVVEWVNSSDLSSLLRSRAPDVAELFSGDFLDQAKNGFIDHHTRADTELTARRFEDKWVGWCTKRKQIIEKNRGTVATFTDRTSPTRTRDRSITQDLTDTSWAD